MIKHHFEPGKVIDFYPFRDKLTTSTSVAIIACFICAIGTSNPTDTARLVSGLVIALMSFYALYSLLMARSILIVAPIMAGIIAVGFTPLLNGYVSRLLLLCFGLVAVIFGHLHYNRIYSKNYSRWSAGKAERYYRRYRAYFSKYKIDVQPIMLAVMIVEDTARPMPIRAIERIIARANRGKLNSTGIMQVRSSVVLSDVESVVKGFELIDEAYTVAVVSNLKDDELLSYVAYEYNGDRGYVMFLKYFIDYCYTVIDELSPNPVKM